MIVLEVLAWVTLGAAFIVLITLMLLVAAMVLGFARDIYREWRGRHGVRHGARDPQR